MVWTKLPRSIAHRGAKLAADSAAHSDRALRAQLAETRRAERRAEQAQLDMLASRTAQWAAFRDACLALDKMELTSELLATDDPATTFDLLDRLAHYDASAARRRASAGDAS